MYLNSCIEAVHFFSENGFLSFSFFSQENTEFMVCFTETLKGSVNLSFGERSVVFHNQAVAWVD